MLQPPFGSLLGEQAGNLTLVEEIGAGGMGLVFRAMHPVLGKEAAVKVLHASCAADEASRARLLREAQLINRISTPRVPRVTDAGVLGDGRPWIAMELVRGQTLASFIASERRPPVRTAVAIIADMLDVVLVAHGVSIVHRDLKPDNVLISPKGVCVLDFGIAKLMMDTGAAGLTSTGARLGSPGYMSPEQITGQPIDVRTDVYSASVILYEMLAGERPFRGSDFEILSAHTETPPEPLRPRFADVPPELESLVMAGLAKDPSQRFQSARAMRTALGNVAVRL
ncbi:MAG TPA: serine/threonine-protein kinase [Kofleriaceae bacterium]|jgi:serine/threonine-protein kinase